MVTFVKGDIFQSSAQVITNTVNCVGVMGAGLALAFKKKYPTMFEDYHKQCQAENVKPGTPYLWENDEIQILNFPTKRHWRDKSRLDDIEEGLKYLANHYQEMGIYTIALPPLGCGLGGLKWTDVRELITAHLGDTPDLEVFVYEPQSSSMKSKPHSRPEIKDSTKTNEFAATP